MIRIDYCEDYVALVITFQVVHDQVVQFAVFVTDDDVGHIMGIDCAMDDLLAS